MKSGPVDSDRWFDVLFGNDRAQSAVMRLEAGRSTGGPENYHRESDQWLYVISGTGSASVDGREVALEAGTLVLIESGETHEITAGSEPLETLNMYVPPEY